jgi:hypothetical protein
MEHSLVHRRFCFLQKRATAQLKANLIVSRELTSEEVVTVALAEQVIAGAARHGATGSPADLRGGHDLPVTSGQEQS